MPISRPSTPSARNQPDRWRPSPASCCSHPITSTSRSTPKTTPTILLHYENGVRGVVTVAQVCSGRKNRLFFEINGSKSSLAWDGERPNELWIGHRTAAQPGADQRPLAAEPEARQTASYPGGHNEGFPDTFKQLYKKGLRLYLRRRLHQEPRISPPSPMVTMRWCCARRSRRAPKKASGSKSNR